MKKKTWINENIGPLLAVIVVLFCLYIFNLVLFRQVKASDPVTISIIECLKTVIILIVGYYFGSSAGSKNKQEVLDKREEKNVGEG